VYGRESLDTLFSHKTLEQPRVRFSQIHHQQSVHDIRKFAIEVETDQVAGHGVIILADAHGSEQDVVVGIACDEGADPQSAAGSR